jgi:bifunctional DNA-binding transcriptional regulator/antitoxin component of YhaV-PrlF toxin-antitoxin module
VSTKAKVTEEGLLIPKEVAERALGEGSDEVEIFEEPGRLLISPAGSTGEAGKEGADERGDPILSLGEDPVEDHEATDASVNHDRYLYTGG